ncbi:hypothetical protein [Variovorax ginsengisoli]|uniref:Transposase n=1 Tax=Variovorax ginsengisoli TaxID=363844 RepID=A0ABT9SEJ5_9BURK|nr:hypothetical protein [Variovorax ginsengisoli]MDP9902630.1 hypothetical protein [Variovorax ginsengisoli]
MASVRPFARFVRRIFGLDFRDPVVGQRWLSTHSCRTIEIVGVRITDGGLTWVHFVSLSNGTRSPMPDTYSTNLDEWRHRLRMERRVLVRDPNA